MIRHPRQIYSSISSLLIARHGSISVEVALVITSFLTLVFCIFQVGIRLYIQTALEFGAQQAARKLQVDSTKSLTAGSTNFQTATVCTLLLPPLKCTNLIVTLQPVITDYYTYTQQNSTQLSGTLTNSTPLNSGQSKSLMLLQFVYIAPALRWPFTETTLATYHGTTGAALVAKVPYQNEY